MRREDTIRTANSLIYVDINSFSAFVVTEISPIYIPNTTVNSTVPGTGTTGTTSGSAGSSSSDYDSTDLSSLENEIDKLKESMQNLLDLFSTQEGIDLETPSISMQLYPGESTTTTIHIKNNMNSSLTATTNISGSVSDFLFFQNPAIMIPGQADMEFSLKIFIPLSTRPGIYLGNANILVGTFEKKVPVDIRVLATRESLLDLKVQPLTDEISPGGILKAETSLYNMGKTERVDVQLNLQLIRSETEEILVEEEESLAIETTISTIKSLKIPKEAALGNYIIRATAYYTAGKNQTMHATSLSYVKIVEPWYNRKILYDIPFGFFVAGVLFIVFLFVARYFYRKKKERQRKYKEQLNLSTLPKVGERSLFIGKIAQLGNRAFFPMDDLQTHIIIAGATGGGKSVAAQVIVEEALKKGAGVIVFDPTAQWSGFLRKCEDKKMLDNYRKFQMKSKEARGFDGNIFDITDPRTIIDMKKYMSPNEIYIFTLNKLTPNEIDLFVSNVINQVFELNLPESPNLKQLLVFDEVHRLLPKFGGSGSGFIQVERGCREFRKWGVGLTLISQVLSDFVGEIKANIGSEIQVRTRDEGDLKRIKGKYGEDAMRSIIKASVGTGMLQNAEFNKGNPYFVSFRPLLHSTKRLSDKELGLYNTYNKKMDILFQMVEQLKESGLDMFDIELEMKLAMGKIKKGAFNMVDIYLETLEPRIKEQWNKLGKSLPEEKRTELVSEEKINRGIKEAVEARKKYLDEEKTKEKARKSSGKVSVSETGKSGEEEFSETPLKRSALSEFEKKRIEKNKKIYKKENLDILKKKYRDYDSESSFSVIGSKNKIKSKIKSKIKTGSKSGTRKKKISKGIGIKPRLGDRHSTGKITKKLIISKSKSKKTIKPLSKRSIKANSISKKGGKNIKSGGLAGQKKKIKLIRKKTGKTTSKKIANMSKKSLKKKPSKHKQFVKKSGRKNYKRR